LNNTFKDDFSFYFAMVDQDIIQYSEVKHRYSKDGVLFFLETFPFLVYTEDDIIQSIELKRKDLKQFLGSIINVNETNVDDLIKEALK